MTEIENLELKYQLTNEYLRNGGIEKILDPRLLQEMIDVKHDQNLNPLADSIGPRLRSFMTMMLFSQTMELPVLENFQSEYDSLIQKSYSFDQIQINTEDEFDNLISKFENPQLTLFRGQREASWRLYNSLQRMWITKQLSQTQETYLSLIKKLITFGREAHGKEIISILEKYSINSLNDVSILGYLQHHGCPTPLLDWTYNIDIALYFAIDGLEENKKVKEIKDFFSVYYLEDDQIVSYKDLLNNSIETIGDKLKNALIEVIAKDKATEEEMKEKFKGRKYFDKERFDDAGLINGMTEIDKLFGFQISFFSDRDVESGLIFSLMNSPNVKNQSGVFMLNPNSINPLEVVGKEMYISSDNDNDASNYRFCRCLNIHKSLETHVRKYLSSRKIDKEFVYASKDVNTWPIYENSLKNE